MRNTLKVFFLLSILFSFTACLQPDTIRLNDKEKKEMVEKLFQEEAAILAPKLDQGCSNHYYRILSKATDSLVNVYLDSLNNQNTTK